MEPKTLRTLQLSNPWLLNPGRFPDDAAHRVPEPFVPRSVPAAESWPSPGKAHIVIGARQVGKSSWLWRRLVDGGTAPLYIDAEQPAIRAWASSPIEMLDDLRGLLRPGTPVLIDEAQWLDEAGLLLKGLVDGGLTSPLYVTGSSSYHLHARTRESLAGRAKRVRLDPLSLEEIAANDLELPPLLGRARAREHALRHMVVGGYPEVWLSDRPAIPLAELVEAHVIRDASDLFKVQHLDAFRRLLDLAAGQASSLVNLSEWATHLAIARDTVSSYVDILVDAHLLYRLRPFAGGRRAELTRNPKIYFADPGIRNLVINRLDPFEHRPDRGPVLETWVGAELRKHLSPLRPGDALHFWRSKSGAEVDFVIARPDAPIGVEVKASPMQRPKLSRSARSFIDAYRPSVFVVVNLALHADDRIGDTEVRWRPPEALVDVPGMIRVRQ